MRTRSYGGLSKLSFMMATQEPHYRCIERTVADHYPGAVGASSVTRWYSLDCMSR